MATFNVSSYGDGSGVDIAGVTAAVAAASNGDTIQFSSNAATSGTWTLTYGANTTSALAYNASASAVHTALNALASITSDGGVTVTGYNSFDYRIAWNTAGVRATSMTGTSSILPAGNNIVVSVSLAGTASVKELRYICIGALWTSKLSIDKTVSLLGGTTVSETIDHYSNGSSTSASTTFLSASASSAWVGRNIYCAQRIADETTVVSVVAGVSATLSIAATATASSLKFTVGYKITHGTIIQDGNTNTASNTRDLIAYTVVDGYSPVIRGLTIDRTPCPALGVELLILGVNHTFRVTQCAFINRNTTNVSRYSFYLDNESDIWGVMDRCYSVQYSGSEKFSHNHGGYKDPTYTDGELSWTEGPNWYPNLGTAFFTEDCEFVGSGGSDHGFSDGQHGGRSVHRYCYWFKCRDGNHGCEVGHSGMRMRESYLNYYDYGSTQLSSSMRSATVLLWGHTILCTGTFSGWDMVSNRSRTSNSTTPPSSWGSANGFNPLDKNVTESDGTWVEGHPGRNFGNGTQTINSRIVDINNVPTQLVIDNMNGTLDWTGYSISDIDSGTISTSVPELNNAGICIVVSNTGTSSQATLTVAATDNPKNAPTGWTVGHHIAIGKVIRIFEAPGTGLHDITEGNPPAHPSNDNWPHQNLEPCYNWMNTLNGSVLGPAMRRSDFYGAMNENHDWFNQNTSFAPCTNPALTLSTGTGYGTHANRPHCTYAGGGAQIQSGTGNEPGVAYWETDTNTLFVCTATDTWTPYYQPYIYPHPLTGAATGKIISVPSSHDFGNVIVGNTATFNVPISNFGDTLLTVSGVTYPTGYSGPTGSFTVAAGATVFKLATFTPVAATTYSGNIVFANNADSGNGTCAVTGVGVIEAGGGGGHGKGHKKGVLSRRA